MTKHADLLLAAGVAGTDTSHAARTNLHKINQLLEHHDSTTFRVEDLLWEVSFEETYEETYEVVASQLGYPPDYEETPGAAA